MSLNELSNYHVFDIVTIVLGLSISIWLWKRAKSLESDQLRSYIPVMWTSLGIFFTFLSIYLSLRDYGSESDVVAINNEVRYNSIKELIRNIIPAFSTSIIGIFGAIVSTIVGRLSIAELEKKDIDKFREISSLIIGTGSKSDSPELMLLEIVRSIKDSSNNTCSKLERLNDRTNNVISNALNEQRNDFSQALDDLSTRFEQTLTTQQNTLSSKMDDLRRMLHDEIQNIENTNHSLLNKLIDQEKELLRMTTESLFKESKERNEQLQKFITQSDNRILEFIKTENEGIIALYKSIDEGITNHINREEALFRSEIKQAINDFAELQHRLSSETITQCNAKLITDANDYLKNHIGAMSVYLSSLDNQIKETHSSFIKTIKGIAATVESKLQTLYNQQACLIEKTINDNQKFIDHALSENAQSIEAILKANEEAIRDASNEIKLDNENIKTELAAAQKRWKEEAVNAEREHSNEIKSIHSEAENNIQNILEKITNYESAIQGFLNKINGEIIKSVQVYEQKMDGVKDFIVENNKGLHNDLTEQIHKAFQIKELETACTKLTNNINSTISSLNNSTTDISNSLSTINNSLEESSRKYIDTVVNSKDLLLYINEILQVDKQNITSVAAILGEIEKLNKATEQIEDNIKRIQSMQDDLDNNQPKPRKK